MIGELINSRHFLLFILDTLIIYLQLFCGHYYIIERASCKMMIFAQNQGMRKNFTAGICLIFRG